MKSIMVLDDRLKDRLHLEGFEVMTPMEYILSPTTERQRVYNMSAKLGYQDLGYYVSLLAMARNDRVLPSARTIQDLKDRRIQKLYSEDMSELIQKKFKKLRSNSFELSVYFGSNLSEQYDKLAWELYRIVQAPVFRVTFEKEREWEVKKIKLLELTSLNQLHLDFFTDKAKAYIRDNKSFKPTQKSRPYDIAILVNNEELSAPSDQKALDQFGEAFKAVGLQPYFIEHRERPHIGEYDALFVRETTNVSHHTYRLARQAEKEGLVVLDDPSSIVKCSNKVFLEQLMERLGLPRPKTVIWDEKMFEIHKDSLTFPCVIKKPDSAFSQGVFKAKNSQELQTLGSDLFRHTDLILIQEYLPTDFDWRIGILDGEVIYACKYFMARDHWQIINNQNNQEEGGFECVDPKLVDDIVTKIALKITSAIGNGLYGVDLKQSGDDVYIIEVNDNPSIDSGIEDGFAKEKLYSAIAEYFLKKCQQKKGFHES